MCNGHVIKATLRVHHYTPDSFSRDNGKGLFIPTAYIPTSERVNKRFPLLLTTGRILSQYNVGAQTRRTHNHLWHAEDILEIHPHDAPERGIESGDFVLPVAVVVRRHYALRYRLVCRRVWFILPSTIQAREPMLSPPITPTGPLTALNTR